MDKTTFPELQRRVAAEPAFDELTTLLRSLRPMQAPSGAILPERLGEAAELVDRLAATARTLHLGYAGTERADAFDSDIEAWKAAGLVTPPRFDATRDALRPPGDGDAVFALAPYRLANGPAGRGYFFEYFVGMRNEPAVCDKASALFPHPRNLCQSLQVIKGSPGIAEGTSIVFFPENIASTAIPDRQEFAMFFFSKFHRIYNELTAPAVRALFGDEDLFFGGPLWRSMALSESDNYEARCIWGYLHDRFHHIGDRPFDQNIKLKMNWFVGLLEEIKVDCQSALACLDADVPFGREVFQFIVFDRTFRYPRQPDAPTNFDAGTGFLMFRRLVEDGAYRPTRNGGMTTDLASVRASLAGLVEEILALEAKDDDAYRDGAMRLVRRYLPEGGPGEKFTPPADVSRFLGLRTPELQGAA